MEMGLPLDVTSWCRRSISEKAVCSPYHCDSYWARPTALVMGSSKMPSSVQSWSFLREGRPAKSWGWGWVSWWGLRSLVGLEMDDFLRRGRCLRGFFVGR